MALECVPLHLLSGGHWPGRGGERGRRTLPLRRPQEAPSPAPEAGAALTDPSLRRLLLCVAIWMKMELNQFLWRGRDLKNRRRQAHRATGRPKGGNREGQRGPGTGWAGCSRWGLLPAADLSQYRDWPLLASSQRDGRGGEQRGQALSTSGEAGPS